MNTKGLKILFFKPFVFSDPHSNLNRPFDRIGESLNRKQMEKISPLRCTPVGKTMD